MLELCKRLPVRVDHAIAIPRACCPGKWFGAGEAFLAPLHRKRVIYLDRAKWVHAWTIYNAKLETHDWRIPATANGSLHLPIEIRSRDPSGWMLTIPIAIREKGWLPEGPAFLMFEYSATEANLWTEAAYNEESILEADAV